MWSLLFSWAFAADPSLVLRDAIAARLDVPPSDVEVRSLGIANIPADADWKVELPNTGNLWGTISVRLIASHNGTELQRYTAYAKVSVWDEVPVAAAPVAPGEPVAIELVRMSLEELRGASPVDPDRAWKAKTTIQAGVPLTTSRVEAVPDAPKGSKVRIVVQRGALQIESIGLLTEDAWVGQPVTVQSLATQVELTGVYEKNGLVSVGVP